MGKGLVHRRHFGLMETDVKVQILMNFLISTSFTGRSYTKNSSVTPIHCNTFNTL